MTKIENLVRQNIKNMCGYSSARHEYDGSAHIFLDANESPCGELNRYPAAQQDLLKRHISQIWQVAQNQVFVGNGSDEAIDLIFRIFCEPGLDRVLSFTPTYGMYSVCAQLNNVEMIEQPLNEAFDLDDSVLDDVLKTDGVKVIFVCSPNNPTGNLISPAHITRLLTAFSGLVVIDEAYIQFSEAASWVKLINKFPNVIVLQTLSKAWALAGARIGMAFAQPEIIALFNKAKMPYNVSLLNQNAAVKAIQNQIEMTQNVKLIQAERSQLCAVLQALPYVVEVYPSDANFILLKVDDADALYNFLCAAGIIIRNRNSQLANCVRITVGLPKENRALMQALNNFKN